MALGKKIWLIPDCFWPEVSNGAYVSHEAICVINAEKTAANIKMTLYFEDREPMTGFTATCNSERCNHIRMDKQKNDKGETVPVGVPYAVVVESDVDVVVQYSRMDTTQSEIGLATTVAFPVE